MLVDRYVLDISRLIVRSISGRQPTGVDNVVLGYLENLKKEKVLYFRYLFLQVIFTKSAQSYILKKVLQKQKISFLVLVGIIFSSLFEIAKYRKNKADYFLNLGHYNLDKHWMFGEMKKIAHKTAVLIHDLIPITHPKYTSDKEQKKHKLRIINSAKFSNKIFFVSNETKNQFIKYSKENGINVTASLYVVKSASHKKFKLSENRDHYLMVGTIEPRKGYKEILKLWKNKKISYSLVIIGQKGWMCGDEIKLIEELKSQGLIKWEKSCSDSKLDDYYSRSFALIQNSYYEGYGLPVLEAINNGLRVYARDISALSEFDENSIIKYKHIDGLYRLIKDNHLLDKQISFQNQRTWREASSELEALLLL